MEPEDYDVAITVDSEAKLQEFNSDAKSIDEPEDVAKAFSSKNVQSPTIPIPKPFNNSGGKLDFNVINCHVGSKTPNDEMTFESFATSKQQQEPVIMIQSDKTEDNLHRSYSPSECKVSEMSTESIIWLSHRLGPVLTARYLSRNLLRMLTLCYTSRENLTPLQEFSSNEQSYKITVMGDLNATKVLECLTSIASEFFFLIY